MPAQLELEEEVEGVRKERERHALERRERNSLAIAEVVGRNPARNPGDAELVRPSLKEQLRIRRN